MPYEYLDRVYVKLQGNTYNIYFGGVDKPNGAGHGHYAMTTSGEVIYRREPFDPHGPQNYADHAEREVSDRSAKAVHPR